MTHLQIFKSRNFLWFVFLFFICHKNLFAQSHKEFIVVLDAGHGGKDPGKIGYKNAKEKDVALSIVLKAGKLLEKVPGLKVIYTRKKDVFVDLWRRGDIANEADADLFVSVHCNAHTSQAMGAETWVLGLHANERNFSVAKAENEVILQEENHQERYQGFDPKSPTSVIGLSLEQEEYLDQSLLLASLIQQEFEEKLKRVNRGVKQAGFVVLYQTYMPSVLIETGFLTNKIEGKFLYSKVGQKAFAGAIANSISDYFEINKLNVADTEFTIEEETDQNSENSIKNSSKELQSLLANPSNLEVYYKVQIASSRKKVETLPQNFKGLNNIEAVKVGGFYKYYYGIYKTYSEAQQALVWAKKKSYHSSFIATFKNKPTISKKEEQPVFQKNKQIVFKIQLASSRKKVELLPQNFKGLSPMFATKVGQFYKYYFSETNSYNKAKLYLEQARKKDYNSAFVVAFLGEKRITVKEALKIQKK